MAEEYIISGAGGQHRSITEPREEYVIAGANSTTPPAPKVDNFTENVIDAERLSNEHPMTIPQATPSQADAFVGEITAESTQVKETSERERQEYAAQQAQKQVDTSRRTLTQRAQELLGMSDKQIQMEEEAGLPGMRQDIAQLTSQIEAREHSLRRQVEATQQQGGLTQTQANRRIIELQRQAFSEMADMSIVLNAKLRNFDAVQQSIDRKIQIQTEGLKMQLEFDMMFYQENREMLSKTEDRAFQLRIQEEERAYQEVLHERQQIGNIMMTAAQYGANATQIGQIGNAKTFEQAIAVGSEFLGRGWALQVEAQMFSQRMQELSHNLQLRQVRAAEDSNALARLAAEQDAIRKADEFNLKVGADFTRDTRVQQFQTTEQSYGRLNAIAPDREIETFEKISGNNAEEKAIVTQFIRMTQPDIARAADAGDITQTAKLEEQITSTLDGLRRDKATLPRKLQEIAIASDKLYNAGLDGLESANIDFNSRLQSGVVLPNVRKYEQIKQVDISSQINEATRQGFSFRDILDHLSNDALLGNQIKAAQRNGYDDKSIINYLMNL